MSGFRIHSALAVARADFCERRRRYSFLLALLFTAFLCYQVAAGQVLLTFDGYRGVYNSAWVGTSIALLANSSTLLAFYILRTAVERDWETGAGQILAATPLSNSTYLAGKLLSNWAVVGSVLGVFAAAAPLLQLLLGEDRNLHPWPLYSPLLLLSLPAMTLTAAAALCFELLPVLRTRIGNVIWLLLWSLSIPTPSVTHRGLRNAITGMWALAEMERNAALHIPHYRGFAQFDIDIHLKTQIVKGWEWAGYHWTVKVITAQMGWIVLAFVLPLLVGAIFFRRFDVAQPAQSKSWIRDLSHGNTDAPDMESGNPDAESLGQLFHLTAMDRGQAAAGFGELLQAELRLAYSRYPWWWYAVALGLMAAQCTAPLTAARGPILATTWLWSVLTWSAMGSRELHNGTQELLLSCANLLPRQFAACFLAGFVTAILSGTGVAVRLAFAGSITGLFAWFAGTLLVPALAIVLGNVSGSSKPFEGGVGICLVCHAQRRQRIRPDRLCQRFAGGTFRMDLSGDCGHMCVGRLRFPHSAEALWVLIHKPRINHFAMRASQGI